MTVQGKGLGRAKSYMFSPLLVDTLFQLFQFPRNSICKLSVLTNGCRNGICLLYI